MIVTYSGCLVNEDKKESISIRQKILNLQSSMVSMESAESKCELKHTFSKGAYARQLSMPKDILIVGKIHKHGHLNIVSKGRVLVVTEFEEIEIDASKEPYTFTSEPGTKRVVYTLEDTVWTTIHLTEETDLEKIENEIIAKDYNDFDLLDNQTKCKEIS